MNSFGGVENQCRVSVIMLTMNRAQYIEPAIVSVRNQTFQDWELIIVQDGSDERVRNAVNPWLVKEARIRYFHRSEVGNIANGTNFAIARAKGRFIAILDDDDAWIHPDKLAMQVAMMVRDEDVVCVGGGALVVDVYGNEVMRYLKPAQDCDCRRRALLTNPLIHSTALYRKSSADSFGLYDDTLNAFADYDFCLKLMRCGRLINLPEYFVSYRVWDEGSSSRYGMSIAWSNFKIINRHFLSFRYYPIALLVGAAHLFLALFPRKVRARLYQFLSKKKKKIFSATN